MKNPRIEIIKKRRILLLYSGGDVIREFDVAFGSTPQGAKEVEGDGRTPEGEYFVCVKNPESKFHLSLALNYPNESDARRGLASGRISKIEHDAIVEANRNRKLPPQNTALGGEIYIHGGGVDGDWTRGCIALADDEMTELFEAITLDTSVRILS